MSLALWVLGLAVFSTMISAVGTIFVKKGSSKFSMNIFEQIKNWRLIIGISMYLISAVFYLVALKHGELSIIYPIASATYIWVALLSQKFLNEKMNLMKWLGIMLIICGIVLINL